MVYHILFFLISFGTYLIQAADQTKQSSKTNPHMLDELSNPFELVENYNTRIEELKKKRDEIHSLIKTNSELLKEIDQCHQFLPHKAPIKDTIQALITLTQRASGIQIPSLIDSEKIKMLIAQEDIAFSEMLSVLPPSSKRQFSFSATKVFEQAHTESELFRLKKLGKKLKGPKTKLDKLQVEIGIYSAPLLALRSMCYEKLIDKIHRSVTTANRLYRVDFKGLLEHPLFIEHLSHMLMNDLNDRKPIAQFLSQSPYYRSTIGESGYVRDHEILLKDLTRSYKIAELQAAEEQELTPKLLADLRNYCCACNKDIDTDDSLACLDCHNTFYCSITCKARNKSAHEKFCSTSKGTSSSILFKSNGNTYIITDNNQSNYTFEFQNSIDSAENGLDSLILRNKKTNESFTTGIYAKKIFFAQSNHRNHVIPIRPDGFSLFLLRQYINSSILDS